MTRVDIIFERGQTGFDQDRVLEEIRNLDTDQFGKVGWKPVWSGHNWVALRRVHNLPFNLEQVKMMYGMPFLQPIDSSDYQNNQVIK